MAMADVAEGQVGDEAAAYNRARAEMRENEFTARDRLNRIGEKPGE